MPGVFISYERSGEATAAKVAEALRAMGHAVWSDAELPAHRAYAVVIQEQLAAADAVLVLWSRDAADSEWVRAEAEFARENGKLVQAAIDDSLPPMPFNQTHCASLRGWRGDPRNAQWLKVLASLDQLAPAKASPLKAADPGRRARWPKPLPLVLGALLAVVVAGAGWFIWTARERPAREAEPQTVVLPFKALTSDGPATAFALAADSDIAGTLSENQIQTLTLSHASQADFAINGTVQRGGDNLVVRVRLDDPRAGVTLWSAEFTRPADDAAGMRTEVGWRLADVMSSAAEARQNSRGRLSPAELGLFIQARDALAVSDVQSAPLAAELVRRAPDFAPGHAMMCMMGLSGAARASPLDFVALRDRALAECHASVRLDPHLALPLRGLSYGEDGRQWARREAVLRAPGVDPDGPDIQAILGELLAASGREDEGIRLLQHAAAAKKGWTIYSSSLALALLSSDHFNEAPPLINQRLALRPQDIDARVLAFLAAAFQGPPDAASALLDAPDLDAVLGPGLVSCYRAFLNARRTGAPGDHRAAIATILRLGDAAPARAHAAAMLATLGDTDDAFRVANLYAHDPLVVRAGMTLQPNFLFSPSTAAMRADPRFIPLAKTLGLLDYWRSSGRWPDFCRSEAQAVCAAMKKTS